MGVFEAKTGFVRGFVEVELSFQAFKTEICTAF